MRYETGQTYGTVTLVRRIDGRRWECMCKCGLPVVKDIGNLKRTITCGHLCKFNPLRKHGMTGTKEYRAWKNIKTRCTNDKFKQARDYKQRGIAICAAWSDSFDAFYADVGPCPGPGFELDRVDNSRGYEPGNVRWVPHSENCNNKRNNVLLEYKGETKTATQWARNVGLKPSVVLERIRNGWDVVASLETPPKT
jgi:hypothetical protein